MTKQEVKKIEPFKRFMVFACWVYEPNGGLDDVIGSFDTIEEAQEREKAIKETGQDYTEIFDRVLGVRVSVDES